MFNYSKQTNFSFSNFAKAAANEAAKISTTTEKQKNPVLAKAKELYEKHKKAIQVLQTKMSTVEAKLKTLDFNKFVKDLKKAGVNLDNPQALNSLALANTPHMALMLRYKIIGDDARGRIDKSQIKMAPSKTVATLASQTYNKPSLKAEIYKLCYQRAILDNTPDVGIALFQNKNVPKNLKLKLVEKCENVKFLQSIMLEGYSNNDYTYINKIPKSMQYLAVNSMHVKDRRFVASTMRGENTNGGAAGSIMSGRPDAIARINLINNKSFSLLNLSWFVKDGSPKVRKAMMNRVTKELMSSTFESYSLLDLRMQTELLKSKDPKVRAKLAGYRDLDRRIVKELAYDPSSLVKLALITNNLTWEAELKILAREDKDKKVQEAATLRLAKLVSEKGGA